MKEIISENYNLKIEKIYNKNDEMYFFINDYKIIIKKVLISESEISSTVEISNKLYENGHKINTIIVNKKGEYITKIKNEKIVLMRENSVVEKANLATILSIYKIKINNSVTQLSSTEDYSKIVDDVEQKIITYNKEFKKIQNSMDYFIGLAENSIQLLDFCNKNKEIEKNTGIIINSDNIRTSFEKEFYNPLNIRIGEKELTIANYFKWKIYTDYIDFDELEELKKEKLNYTLLLAYLLFPNFYFNDAKMIMNNKIDEKIINKYTDKNKNYIHFLKYYINKYIDKIDGFNKNSWINLQ